ncbi:MAG TPA: transcriptional regulator GcvA [Burkholderiales bacterium]|nr:transcriptional regulator GcvA [Burkholderiales bacterium]
MSKGNAKRRAARAPRLPPLAALRVFECVSRHMSFTEAARELSVTQGAVSHQIRALESWLGFELFQREGRTLRLSRGARAYAETIGAALQQIAAHTDALRQARSHEVLTVRGYTTFLVRWLIPRLPSFQAAHPEVEIRLEASADPVDFRRDQADVAVLYGNGAWADLRADLLFRDELVPVCSPQLTGNTRTLAAAKLLELPLLHLNARRRDWPDWIEMAGLTREPDRRDMRFEDLSIVYQCAIDGLGVAMGQRKYLAEEIANGRLVVPIDKPLMRDAGYYLVCPKESAGDAKVETFRAWLLATLDKSDG